MTSPFSFRGKLSRWRYALGASAAFFAQHALVFAAAAALDQTATLDTPWFWINPARYLPVTQPPPLLTIAAALLVLASLWALAALSLRRAADAGVSPTAAMLAIVPIVQIPAIAFLCWPSTRVDDGVIEPPRVGEAMADARATTMGVLAGTGISVAAVWAAAAIFKDYGFALFVATPFIIALTTAFIANRRASIGHGATLRCVMLSLLQGSVALIFLALEGLICIVLASPLIALLGMIGGVFGKALASVGRKRGDTTTLASVALLPFLFAGETLAPPRAAFESHESIVIRAAPEDVWRTVTEMTPIPDPPGWPLNWGPAYPISGELFGEGVGAVRLGRFSTGVAYERVTAWEPGRALSFVVLSNPPMMRELSPYENIHAPHIEGYFRSTDVRFTITPLGDGSSRLDFVTRHELDIGPAPYWTPLARWMIHENKQRVMAHFKRQAEVTAHAP